MDAAEPTETFQFGESYTEPHGVGDPKCTECWMHYPKKCECGGLVHASFGDEDADGDYWLYRKCDKCGEPDLEVDD